MIIEALFYLVITVVQGLTAILPNVTFTAPNLTGVGTFLGYLAYYFPDGLLLAAITLFLAWLAVHLLADPIMFFIKKIPGIT